MTVNPRFSTQPSRV